MKTDLFGNIPKVGDIIIFNPPQHAGIVWGEVCSISKAGNPQINKYGGNQGNDILAGVIRHFDYTIKHKGFYSLRTNFVIK